MRVGIVALQHETNTFIEAPTSIDAFRGNLLAAGDSLRAAVAGTRHELGGFLAGLEEAAAEAVPLFGARALPYGLVSAAAYAELKRRLLAEIRSHLPLDGLLVAPHGAAVSEDVRDVDGDWLQCGPRARGSRFPDRRHRGSPREPLATDGRERSTRSSPTGRTRTSTSGTAGWRRRGCSSVD